MRSAARCKDARARAGSRQKLSDWSSSTTILPRSSDRLIWRALVAGSYPDPQVARVVGFASSQLFDPKDPYNPVNRRIDIVVLTKKAQRAIEGDHPPLPAPTQGDGAPGEVPADPNALPPEQEPLPAHELRQKLNLFDDGGVKDPTAPAPGS